MRTTNAVAYVAYGLRVAATRLAVVRLAVKAYADLNPCAGTDVADIA